MKYNKQLIQYGNEFLKLIKEKLKNQISYLPLITFLIDNNTNRVEMILDIKTDNGNLEKFKDIEIIEENESMEEIKNVFRKRHGDYTASIFKNIEEFTKEKVEIDFKEICSFNFLKEEIKDYSEGEDYL